MAIDIGSTVEGTVVKLAEYGAIVRLQGGKTGLIHISEIADTYVRDVKDYFKEHDRVRVKVLSVNSKGRYELSTKDIEQPVIQSPSHREHQSVVEKNPSPVNLGPDSVATDMRSCSKPATFEEQLSQFMKESQERLLDLKRNLEAKRGSRKR
jgi:S1 RNA binding domain protein